MPNRPLSTRALSGGASFFVGAITLLDMVLGPLVRPIGRFVSASSPVGWVRHASRRLPAYAALAALIVPLAVAEPAKIFALYLIGEGMYVRGIVTLVGAYLVSLVLIDSIYEGARPQLRSISWFAATMDRVIAVRIAVMSVVRASKAYRIAHITMQRIRMRIHRIVGARPS